MKLLVDDDAAVRYLLQRRAVAVLLMLKPKGTEVCIEHQETLLRHTSTQYLSTHARRQKEVK